MGNLLGAPVTDKETHIGTTNDGNLRYGVSSMQGWRVHMEDAHITDVNFDDGISLFAVFDGHGGPEVAKFCSEYFG